MILTRSSPFCYFKFHLSLWLDRQRWRWGLFQIQDKDGPVWCPSPLSVSCHQFSRKVIKDSCALSCLLMTSTLSSKWFYDFKTNLACQLFQCHSKLHHWTEKNIHYNKRIIKFVAGKKQKYFCLWMCQSDVTVLAQGGPLVTTEDCRENWGFLGRPEQSVEIL